MIIRHAAPRQAALSNLSGAGGRALFDGLEKYAQAEMRGFAFAAYTPCEFQVGGQWFARLGCSELTVALQVLEQTVCEASGVARLDRNDVRWKTATDTLDNETSLFSRTAVVLPSNCPQYVQYVNDLTENVRTLMREAGKTPTTKPPKVVGRVFEIIPNEVLWGGAIALGLAAVFYLGPAARAAGTVAAARAGGKPRKR